MSETRLQGAHLVAEEWLRVSSGRHDIQDIESSLWPGTHIRTDTGLRIRAQSWRPPTRPRTILWILRRSWGVWPRGQGIWKGVLRGHRATAVSPLIGRYFSMLTNEAVC